MWAESRFFPPNFIFGIYNILQWRYLQMQNFHYSSISKRMRLARFTADSRHRTRKYSSYIAFGVWWSDSLRCKILNKKWLSKCEIGFRTENGVTVINIDKSNMSNDAIVVCEICSSTLKSMKYLERYMKSVHRGTCFYCFECGKKRLS